MLSSSVLKADPIVDLYGLWSHSYKMFTAVGTRDYLLRYLKGAGSKPGVVNDPESRIARADAFGTSAVGDFARFGDWDCKGIEMQRGFLPRPRLGEFLRVWDERKPEVAYVLLEPMGDV